MIQLVVVAALVSSAFGLRVVGRCPEDREVVSDFQLPSYIGVWYEIERYETRFQPEYDCVTATYSINSDGSVRVNNEALLEQGDFSYNQQIGRAVVSFPDERPLRGLLNVTFFEERDYVNYRVLSTDYTTYSFVWSCYQLTPTEREELIFVLSRTPEFNPRPVIVEQLIDQYFNRQFIRKTIQGERCFKTIKPAAVEP